MDKEYFKAECIKIKHLPKDEQEQAKDKLMDKISDAIDATDSDEALDQLKDFGEILHKFTKFLSDKPATFAKKFAEVNEKARECEDRSKEVESTLRELKRRIRDLEEEQMLLNGRLAYRQSETKILQAVKEILEA
ncbi:hypothetical protein [Herbaspirillum sp. ST 5-3]|uniref:hypothetical protein n=1 Tax=Oxalobacteraceae TaxID=75682 RepID=UPI0010A3612C|nr:hypothetical protein [Herbaspirillum sp. ST 5-3]